MALEICKASAPAYAYALGRRNVLPRAPSVVAGFSVRVRRSPRWRSFARMQSEDHNSTVKVATIRAQESATPKPKEVINSAEELQEWLDRHGLPPNKVTIRDRPSPDTSHHPIHHVVASQDLQAGDVAFSVPNSLVVTLERVLGNESIGRDSSFG